MELTPAPTKLTGASVQTLLHQEGWIEDVGLGGRVNQKVYVNVDGRVFAMPQTDANVGFVYSSKEHFSECWASQLGIPALAALLGYEPGQFQVAWADVTAMVGPASNFEEFIARAREVAHRYPDSSWNFVVLAYALGEAVRTSDPRWNWCLEYESGRISRVSLCSEGDRMDLWLLILRLFRGVTVQNFDFQLALTLTKQYVFSTGPVNPDPPIMNRYRVIE